MIRLSISHNKWFHYLIQMKNINLKNNSSLEFLKKENNSPSYQQVNNILFKLYHQNNNSLILWLFKLFNLRKEFIIITYSPNFIKRWMKFLIFKQKIKRTCKNNESNVYFFILIYLNQILKLFIKIYLRIF